MAGTNLFGEDFDTNTEAALIDESGYAYVVKCTGTPQTTAGKYQKGCLAFSTNATGVGLYVNNGTVAAPVWDKIGNEGTTQALSGAGAIDVTSRITEITTTGANALTLADGVEGQRKTLIMVVDGGAGTLTPTNLGAGTTITFDDVGDTAELVFTAGEWWMISGTATRG
jgi:hypothetical protein